MKTLNIEWRHLDVQGETCDRCYDTGENLEQEVKRLKRALLPQGIEVKFTEIKIDDKQIPQSNTILFNGVPIEDILNIEVSENYCASCTTLLGKDTYCRTVAFEGNEYEDIPAKAIRQAAYKALAMEEEKNAQKQSACCSGGGCGCNADGGCCAPQGKKKIAIDFLYLDLTVCGRCQGTDSSLEEAIGEVSAVLGAAGYDFVLNKVNIATEELAKQYEFVSSPTIRINGRDIALEVKESCCEDCGELCGDAVDCRVWEYEGRTYTVPPKALIVNAILKEVYGIQPPQEKGEYRLPENLKNFFQNKK
ncbi:MAG: DUF2703 domain-containing protein [Christensenellales bacterium]